MPYQVIEIGNQIKVVSVDGTTTAPAPGPAGNMIQENFETISVLFNGAFAQTTVLNTKVNDLEDRADSLEDDIEDHENRIIDIENELLEGGHGILVITDSISSGTVFNINSSGTGYTRIGTETLTLDMNADNFRENEKIIITLNGVVQDKYTDVNWLSSTTFSFSTYLDPNDRIQILNL